MVRFGDSRCARCGSGQTSQGPIRAQAHLQRCSNPECQAFVLNSDTRCSHCGCEAPVFKAFRFGMNALGGVLKAGVAIGILILLVLWVLLSGKELKNPTRDTENPSTPSSIPSSTSVNERPTE